MTSDDKSRKSFIGGVAVLTASTVAVKLIGLFYKIPLIHLVGVEGMAYFLAAYHIYTTLFMLSTAGLPVAVSIMVSKRLALNDRSVVDRIYKISLRLFSLVGGICSAVLYFGADAIACSIEIPEAAYCIRAVSPSLLFTAAGSAVKGYFQGHQNMKPTAVSQIIESIGKLGFGMLFTYIAIRQNLPLPVVAAFAISGLTVGVILSTLYLFAFRVTKRPVGIFRERKKTSTSKILRELMLISTPITLGAVVISIASLIDTALISSRLQSIGFAPAVANAMYSSYGNLSIPIFNLIPSLISPIALSMAPMLSDAVERKDKSGERELLVSSFRLCSIIAIPASIGLAVFGKEILGLVFSGEFDAVSTAAPLLSILAPSVFFSCLITVTNAVLQSNGKAAKPILSMLFGALIKIISEYVLVGIPSINIKGAPISTLLCDLIIVVMNLYFIEKNTCGIDYLPKLFFRPIISAAISTGLSMLIAVPIIRLGVEMKIATIGIVLIDIAIYALIATKTHAVTESDIKMLPFGNDICNIMKKIKLLK